MSSTQQSWYPQILPFRSSRRRGKYARAHSCSAYLLLHSGALLRERRFATRRRDSKAPSLKQGARSTGRPDSIASGSNRRIPTRRFGSPISAHDHAEVADHSAEGATVGHAPRRTSYGWQADTSRRIRPIFSVMPENHLVEGRQGNRRVWQGFRRRPVSRPTLELNSTDRARGTALALRGVRRGHGSLQPLM